MKKSVLFVMNGLYGGGAENVLQTVLSHLERDSFEIGVLSVNQQYIGPEYPEDIYYSYIFGHSSSSDSIMKRFWVKCINKFKLIVYYHLSSKWSYRLFVPKGYDVEIAFIEGYATRIISASTNKHSRKIAWVHTDLVNNHWTDIAYRSRSEESEAYAKFDDVVCVSENVSNSMLSINPSLQNLRVIYNPVDDVSIREKAEESVADSKFIEGQIKLVSVGRLVSQKGYDRLLPILKRLHDEGYSFVMNILGEGPDRSELERYITANEMESYVSLMGFTPNPYPYVRASDLYISSSRAEGFGLTLVEAMLLGVPVISTSCSGSDEVLGFGKYGVVVENADESLYNAIRLFLRSQLPLAFVYEARLRAMFFSVSSFKKQLGSLLE